MIIDVRLWGCDGHFEYIGILWWNRLYMVSYPRVWFGDLQGWKGGGGSGIGGIKSSTRKHEFCIVRSLKLCSFLGCKWGVPLVIGGGDPTWGFWGSLGCHFGDHVGYHHSYIIASIIIHIDYINVHVVQFPMLSFLSCSHSIVQP